VQIAQTIAELQALQANGDIGLVMTMGALHDGHRSLIARARSANAFVFVSIFVNPKQFAPQEDLSRYPRTLEQDLALCQQEGVDLVFVPTVAELYPPNFGTAVVPPSSLTETLCGLSRPGHFTGVATVVAKVMSLVRPKRAYFGQKDAQQVAILRRIAADLSLGCQLVICPIVRDLNGLALSSRNVYLSAQERERALQIPRALDRTQALFQAGIQETKPLLAAARDALLDVEIEYLALVDPETLQPLEKITQTGLLAIAARVGTTRLIDNLLLGQTQVHPPIIAIDGPAGAGKSTVARKLALQLGFLYIDTGAMYRAVTWKAMQLGVDFTDGEALSALTRNLQIRLAPGHQKAFATRVWVDGEEITRAVRERSVSANVSAVSAHLGVRTELVAQQRALGREGGVILDGRDIGTHVFPDAALKIYLTASVQIRAERRLEDLKAQNLPLPEIIELESDIQQRDEKDSTRKHAPLRKADDAIEVITDGQSIEETVEILMALYRQKGFSYKN
jgi:pantoate ligase / CMP/dCMP kinase